MKILWVCNGPVKKYYAMQGDNREGASWIDGLLNRIEEQEELKLDICFPLKGIDQFDVVEDDRISYYRVPLRDDYLKVSEYYVQIYEKIVEECSPDIIHIWGTEFPYILYMVRAAYESHLIGKVVISIQGLCSAIEQHYYAGLPEKIVRSYTFRDWVKNDNIARQRKNYLIRGKLENEAIKMVHYVIGRTDYDHAYTYLINPNVKYFHCNEILRPVFYIHEWKYDECQKHTIFMSQAFYPLKGCHFVLKALRLVKKMYSDVHLYIAGPNIVRNMSGLEGKIKISSYGKYLSRLICQYDLRENVTFLGGLSQEEMCQQYLKSNVFVSASSTENESNSLSEAKILGMPVIASLVGGIGNRIRHQEDGLLYQYDDVYILAYYICELFANEEKAAKLGAEARKSALVVNNSATNYQRQLEIYKEIYYDISHCTCV